MNQAQNKLRIARREITRDSIMDFAKLYFPEYVKLPYCSFHEDICKYLKEISNKHDSRLAIAAPRGHAKSTIVSFFYVMWSICHSKEKFIFILSATAKQAQTLLSDVTNALTTNTRLLEDFSDVFANPNNVKSKLTQDEIITNNNIKITAMGCEQQLRTLKHFQDRPTLIILDDVDSEKNTYNASSREKLFSWFTKTLLKAGAKNFNIIAIGTLLHPDSLLARLTRPQEFPNWDKKIYKAVISFSERKDLWEEWKNILFARNDFEGEIGVKAADKFFEAHREEMLEGTKVLWPEIEDYYKLMKIKDIEGSYSFDSEKQNDPTTTEDCHYDPDKFFYWDKEYADVDKLLASFGNDYYIIGACDPSTGKTSKDADYYAIVILARHKGKLYILKADIKKRSQDQLSKDIIDYCRIYQNKNMDRFVVEANSFPEMLANFIRKRMNEEDIIVPITEKRNTENKQQRIFGMETFITNGIILFNSFDQTLLDQLKYFPRNDHKDDGPDALQLAVAEAIKEGTTFVILDEKKDKHGRTINDPDYGQTTPEEDTWDEDDEEWEQEKKDKKRRDDPNQPPPARWLPLD